MTTYKDLLDRQHELQRLGKLSGHRQFNDTELRLAYLDEMGELIHEFKPMWAWWKKPGGPTDLNKESILGELADVLHFRLIEEIENTYYDPTAEDWEDHGDEITLGGYWVVPGRPTDPISVLTHLAVQGEFALGLRGTLSALISLAGAVGYSQDDLIQAYYDKTEENLRRWSAMETPSTVRREVQVNQITHQWTEGEGEHYRRFYVLLAHNPATDRFEAPATVQGEDVLLVLPRFEGDAIFL